MFSESRYPFSAVVKQENVKQALLIALVNPRAGGLLVGGKKGTGKSVLVRGLKDFANQAQLVELPLNTTEDMLFGSIDIEYAVQRGEKRFSPGLLSRAHDNILYIDEANLLRTELLKAVLDANHKGINTVERDGISFEHPVQTTIIASMNPEEGTLPNQILDRFGMYVETENYQEVAEHVEIIKRILQYDKNRLDFREYFREHTGEIQGKVRIAKELLAKVEVTEAMLQLAAQMCAQAYCAGHRGELYLLEVAKGIAALGERSYILPKDMDAAALYVLPHRMRKPPEPPPEEQQEQEQEVPKPPPQSEEQSQDQTEQPAADYPEQEDEEQEQPESEEQERDDEQNDEQNKQNKEGPAPEEQIADINKAFVLPKMLVEPALNKKTCRGSGKRSLTRTSLKQGRYVRAGITNNKINDLAFDATIRAAAPYQSMREKNACVLNIKNEDLREKLREKRVGNTFLFVVDASSSMGAKERMRSVKGAIFHMLQEAYQKRDRVGMIAFRREGAELLLPVTRSVTLAQKELRTLPTGGKTPLGDALKLTLDTLYAMTKKDLELEPILILVTDGRANYTEQTGADPVQVAYKYAEKISRTKTMCVVIDTESDFIKLGIAQKVAGKMGASYYKLGQLSQERILHIVRNLNIE